MIRINLLPHRAEKRRARKVQFAALAVLSGLAAVFLIGLVQGLLSAKIAYQDGRNGYLKKEIAILDKQIEEIKKLREETNSLLTRKNVVEGLQSTRTDVVHLLDQMLRILPDGVYIKTLKQTGNKITMVGYAQSNARVSTLMRAIEDSPWLDTPALVEIKAASVNNGRLSEYTLTFNVTKADVPTVAPAVKAAANKG
ncbi:MAG: PilN domain-containing protein [Sideroxydans sp.]|nr:PilN domain-containing protein [Sideroxydans sp.]